MFKAVAGFGVDESSAFFTALLVIVLMCFAAVCVMQLAKARHKKGLTDAEVVPVIARIVVFVLVMLVVVIQSGG